MTTPIRTSLSRAPSAWTDEQRRQSTTKAGRQAWRDGILVVRVGDLKLTWPERELVRQIGEKLYGNTGKERETR